MRKKLLAAFLFGMMFVCVFGLTRTWNEANPLGTQSANLADDYLRYVRVDLGERLEDMFYGFNAGTGTGVEAEYGCKHLKLYPQTTPTLDGDYGFLYAKTVTDKELHYLDEDGDEIQLTTGGTIGGATVTLLADKDLIGSSTSDITINTNKFTVAGATGNTVIAGTLTQQGVATLADTSALATSAAPTADAQIANKKYVDDTIGDSYHLIDVDSTSVKVYTKYLTGSCNASGDASVAHGVTMANILSVTVMVYDGTNSIYQVSEAYITAVTNAALLVTYNADNVLIVGGSQYASDPYRIKIEYTL